MKSEVWQLVGEKKKKNLQKEIRHFLEGPFILEWNNSI